ncbi:hypothetical protein PR048_030151 [Dryococelus australis]|uniref:Uncharacterized protein n=1 Tax=Dryococelus australis TaxID=614101 RepID=A0ABQ9G849_9NEOP|nr:hypothetical protein PR048_030151 [Dryococelus australis]
MDKDGTYSSSNTYRSPPVKRLGVHLTPKTRKINRECNKRVENSTPKRTSKIKNAQFGNITPILSNNSSGVAACRKRAFEHNSSASVQKEMLMLDDTFLQTVSLDKVEDCLSENGSSPVETPHDNVLCISPDMFADEEAFSFNDEETVPRVSDCGDANRAGCVNASERTSERRLNRCQDKPGKSGEVQIQQCVKQDISATWTDDSVLEEAVIATLLSCQGSVPIGEKIKKALVNNAQKAVKAKPKCDPSMINLTALDGEGPFFGLPVRVKELIEETKGISKLYCKFSASQV